MGRWVGCGQSHREAGWARLGNQTLPGLCPPSQLPFPHCFSFTIILFTSRDPEDISRLETKHLAQVLVPPSCFITDSPNGQQPSPASRSCGHFLLVSPQCPTSWLLATPEGHPQWGRGLDL